MPRYRFLLGLFIVIALLGIALWLLPSPWLPARLQAYRYALLGEASYEAPPASAKVTLGPAEPFCPDAHADWRKQQIIEGITVEESPLCDPDNPWAVAALVKGTNNVSMDTLMKAGLAPDAVVLENDRDGDGDPDVVHIRLEVAELNGRSPDIPESIPAYAIAPGVQPGFWVFAPKVHGMATENSESIKANPLLRVPSPVIRVEQGDTVRVTLENTHYMPHTIHFHGVDMPFADEKGEGNDGVPELSELPVMAGDSRTYDMTPRHAGTMFYHCHVMHHVHVLIGLQGMFVVEENRPNNWVQTMNLGAGHVRHPSVGVRETYQREYDLHYMAVDRTLNDIIKTANDPRLLERAMHGHHDITNRGGGDYFLLNGRSFPYTFRESLVVVEPDEQIKLRVLSMAMDGISFHPHGHKVTITHSDGVEHPPAAQVTRDVVWVSPAQRVDLRLHTVNDGLHAFGPGIWLLHDHKETSVTTDGLHPGGSMSAIVYRSFLNDTGWPKLQGVDWTPFFTPQYYDKQVPVWTTYDEPAMLGGVESATPRLSRTVLLGFVIGMLAGGLIVVARSWMKGMRST